MSTLESTGTMSGPAEERHAFLKSTALWTVGGLVLAGAVGAFSTVAIAAPMSRAAGGWGGLIVVLGTFFFAHWVCRKMVYGSLKVPGFLLACAAEGTALGFLLLSTLMRFGMKNGTSLVVEALGITAATAGGMLVYAWFSKGELKLVGAFLSMAFIPMLIVMAVGVFFPMGGMLGILVSGVFVVVSAAGLLWRLNYAVQMLGTDQHVEAAYEVTMGVLVLLWNIITLLNRLRR